MRDVGPARSKPFPPYRGARGPGGHSTFYKGAASALGLERLP